MSLAQLKPRELVPGLLTDRGRLIALDGDDAVVGDVEGTRRVARDDLQVDLDDHATFLLCVDVLSRRTGLEPDVGALFYLSEEDEFGQQAWVLEGTEESRFRPADTEDPVESLRRALAETTGEE